MFHPVYHIVESNGLISLIDAFSFGIVSFAKLMCQSSHGWLRMNDTAGCAIKTCKARNIIHYRGRIWSINSMKRVEACPNSNHKPHKLQVQCTWSHLTQSAQATDFVETHLLTTSQIGSLAAKSFLTQKRMQFSAIWVAKTGLWLQESRNKHFKRETKNRNHSDHPPLLRGLASRAPTKTSHLRPTM